MSRKSAVVTTDDEEGIAESRITGEQVLETIRVVAEIACTVITIVVFIQQLRGKLAG